MPEQEKCSPHCWHVKSSTTDGLGKKGYDTVFCCWCGRVARRKWEYVRDPNHGTYADLLLRMDDRPALTKTSAPDRSDG